VRIHRLSFNEHDRSGHGEEGLGKLLLHQVQKDTGVRVERKQVIGHTRAPNVPFSLPSFFLPSFLSYLEKLSPEAPFRLLSLSLFSSLPLQDVLIYLPSHRPHSFPSFFPSIDW